MNANVALKVNESRLFQVLRNAFSSASVLGELMQNARRAGSNWVNFDYDGRDLVIQDGGRGIDDLQRILTAAESGWDQEIQDTESPFGLGFLASLYSAETVTVMSRVEGAETGRSFSASTQGLMQGESFIVQDITMVQGTVIKLTAFDLVMLKHHDTAELRIRQLELLLRRSAQGFSIPVFYNGVELPRTDAVSDSFDATDIGSIQLDLDVPHAHRLYVQGLPLEDSSWGSSSKTVIHLDNSFQVKLPDRQHLVNRAEDVARITKAKAALARRKLEQLKLALPAEEFLRLHARDCAQWGHHDLLDDIPVALGAWFIDWSRADPGHDDPYDTKCTLSGVMDRATLEAAGVCWLADEGDMATRIWQSCSSRFTLADFQSSLLGANHWLRKMALEIGALGEDGEEAIRVAFGPVVGSASVDTWECHRMEVVESISIEHLPSGETHSVSATYDSDSGVLYIVPDADASQYIRLVSDFIEDDRLNEGARYDGAQELERVHSEIVATDPASLVSLILKKSMTSMLDRLAGRTFSVVFGKDGELQAVTEEVAK